MKNKKKIIIIINIIIILFTCSLITKKLQNDTFFTIATAKNVFTSGFDDLDHLTWHDNLNFIKVRWAFDILIYLIYSFFDFRGIYIFVLIIASLTSSILFNILLKKNNNFFISLLLTILSIYFCTKLRGFTARAQVISFLLLLIEIYTIEKLIETNNKIYTFILFVISVLIANFHASVWLMTEILMLPYLVDIVLGKFIKKHSHIILNYHSNIKLLVITIFIIAIGGLCNPNGLITYTYIYKNINGLSPTFIIELQKLAITDSYYVLGLLTIYLGILIFTNTKVKLSDILLFLGLTLMMTMARRNQIYFYLIAVIPFSRLICNFIDDNIKLKKIFSFINSNLTKPLYSLIVVLILIAISINNLEHRVREEYISVSDYPVDITNYIKENIDVSSLRIFNHFNFGSYLEFNDIPAFIDSRSEIFCQEFNDTQILKDWLDATRGNKNYQIIFDKYDINYALLYNAELINLYIYNDPNYKLIYQDDIFCLYKKI